MVAACDDNTFGPQNEGEPSFPAGPVSSRDINSFDLPQKRLSTVVCVCVCVCVCVRCDVNGFSYNGRLRVDRKGEGDKQPLTWIRSFITITNVGLRGLASPSLT